MNRVQIASAMVVAGIAATLAATSSLAAGGPQPNERASDNCRQTIARQAANGQTGAATGSGKDAKTTPSSVTNCDHYWQDTGVIGLY